MISRARGRVCVRERRARLSTLGLGNSMEFPVIFPVSREFASRDEFESDCVRRHGLARPILRRQSRASKAKLSGAAQLNVLGDFTRFQCKAMKEKP